MTWQAAQKWATAREMGANARRNACAALQALGIDPGVVWAQEKRTPVLDELGASHPHHGQALLRYLKANRFSQSDLARAAGITRAAVGVWCTRERFSPGVWRTVADALRGLALKPENVFPAPLDPQLVAELETWSPERLDALRQILKAANDDEKARQFVLGYVHGALRQALAVLPPGVP